MTGPRIIRADLHNHTHHSPDSILSPERFVREARRRGLDCIAVTDHNTIAAGAVLKPMVEREALSLIVGEEVRSSEGEILGLFLNKKVPFGLSPEETIERIKSQGGLVGVPHPFDYLRSALSNEALVRLIDRVDFIECLNARMVISSHNDRAREVAAKYNLPMSAGSDAHSSWEVARAYVEMPEFDSPPSFLASLRAGALRGRLSSPFIHMVSRYAVLRRRLGWRPA